MYYVRAAKHEDYVQIFPISVYYSGHCQLTERS